MATTSTSSYPSVHKQSPVVNSGLGETKEDNASSTYKAAIFQRLHPRVYLERFLAEDVRPDGRSLGVVDNHAGSVIGEGSIWREVSVNVGMFLSAPIPLPVT